MSTPELRINGFLGRGALDKLLDKLDKFHVLRNITESQCKSMREREIAQSERLDLNR